MRPRDEFAALFEEHAEVGVVSGQPALNQAGYVGCFPANSVASEAAFDRTVKGTTEVVPGYAHFGPIARDPMNCNGLSAGRVDVDIQGGRLDWIARHDRRRQGWISLTHEGIGLVALVGATERG